MNDAVGGSGSNKILLIDVRVLDWVDPDEVAFPQILLESVSDYISILAIDLL